jgi:multidrug efflux system outer membrane protein
MIRNLHQRTLLLGGLALFLTGCAVGPKYQRPAIAVPDTYRGAPLSDISDLAVQSLGDQDWSEVFSDPQLQQLIRVALDQNYDVRIAATRILQAEAQLGVTRADQYPTLDATAEVDNQRTAESRFSAFETSQAALGLSAAWELDFWGKYRSATEEARAILLSTEWARRAVINTLIADIASSYFRLRELDLELEISRRTLASRQESLGLIQNLADQGLTNMLDVRQAEQLVYTAGARIPEIERRIEQQENRISALLGQGPGPVTRGRELIEQPSPLDVPAGIPSALLERRPDIQRAEQQLIGSNARIGVARAAYFPQISLTGSGGFRSSALGNLLSGPAGMWNVLGGLTQPIFAGGRIRSGVELTEAQQQEALLVYQQTIQQAFREVSDALVAYRKKQELRRQQELLTQAAQQASELSEVRYSAGLTSYLEVLTNETNLFSAELGLAEAQVEELEALVQIYRALGGGWQS